MFSEIVEILRVAERRLMINFEFYQQPGNDLFETSSRPFRCQARECCDKFQPNRNENHFEPKVTENSFPRNNSNQQKFLQIIVAKQYYITQSESTNRTLLIAKIIKRCFLS